MWQTAMSILIPDTVTALNYYRVFLLFSLVTPSINPIPTLLIAKNAKRA